MNKIKLLCLATLSLGISYASEIASQFAALNPTEARRTATEQFRRAEDLAVQLAAAGGGALAGFVDPAPLNAQIAILTAERDNFANTVVPGLQASEAALQAQVALAGAPFQQQITDLTVERDNFVNTVVPDLTLQITDLTAERDNFVNTVVPDLTLQIANLTAERDNFRDNVVPALTAERDNFRDNVVPALTAERDAFKSYKDLALEFALSKDSERFTSLVAANIDTNQTPYLKAIKDIVRPHLKFWTERLLPADGQFIVNCTTNYTRDVFTQKLINNSAGNIIRDITWVQVVPPAQPGLNDHATFRKALVGNIAEQIEVRLRAGIFHTKADGDDVLAADVAASGLLPDLTLATFLTTLKDYLNNQVI